jgi:hypothetical protein
MSCKRASERRRKSRKKAEQGRGAHGKGGRKGGGRKKRGGEAREPLEQECNEIGGRVEEESTSAARRCTETLTFSY